MDGSKTRRSMAPCWNVESPHPRSGQPRSVWGDSTRAWHAWTPRGKAKRVTLRTHRTGR